MSKPPIKSSKTTSEFPEYRIGYISQTISLAFGNSSKPPTAPPASSAIKRLGELKQKQTSSNLFLTEAEMHEYEISKAVPPSNNALSYEEMIQEIDSISSGIKNRHDDLAELRKKIARCQVGLQEREQGLQGLHRSMNEMHTQSKSLMQKMKSMSSFKRY